MHKGTNKDLALHRLSMSEDCIKTAKRDLENDDFKACANRTYYAIFHALRAVLALEAVDFRKHSGVISH